MGVTALGKQILGITLGIKTKPKKPKALSQGSKYPSPPLAYLFVDFALLVWFY